MSSNDHHYLKSLEKNVEDHDYDWGVPETPPQLDQIDVRLSLASTNEPPKTNEHASNSQKSVRFHGAGR